MCCGSDRVLKGRKHLEPRFSTEQPSRHPGPPGWRVLVPQSYRCVFCWKTYQHTRKPHQICKVKATERQDGVFFITLCWKGEYKEAYYIKILIHLAKSIYQWLSRWTTMPPPGWRRTWTPWTTTSQHCSVTLLASLCKTSGKTVRPILKTFYTSPKY